MEEVVILAGFMGAGKTATGKALAATLGWDFVDLDEEIERESGQSIPEIFDRQGEAHFRTLESTALSRVLERRRLVVATGGGVVLRDTNRLLMEGRRVYYLYASPDELVRRLRKSRTPRPLLAGDDPEPRVRKLYAEREALYEAAGQRVDTEGKSPEEVAREIAGALGATVGP